VSSPDPFTPPLVEVPQLVYEYTYQSHATASTTLAFPGLISRFATKFPKGGGVSLVKVRCLPYVAGIPLLHYDLFDNVATSCHVSSQKPPSPFPPFLPLCCCFRPQSGFLRSTLPNFNNSPGPPCLRVGLIPPFLIQPAARNQFPGSTHRFAKTTLRLLSGHF